MFGNQSWNLEFQPAYGEDKLLIRAWGSSETIPNFSEIKCEYRI